MTDSKLAFPILLERFSVEHLGNQRAVSSRTIAAYRDTFRLLLDFAKATIGKAPTRPTLADLDAQLILSFLDHLEKERSNGAHTHNARLAALRSFLKYAAHYDLAAPHHRTGAGHSDETVRPAGPGIFVTRGDAGDP
ncbi:site-specific integrase [Mesorhizobium sp. C420B]|uniref:site-specific integrase n=1 Tax=unclassified Mesorhizobium TaxID=325217 RepID=UPI00041C7FCC|nr:site-specific integrase [Mesorhizobium sp. LSHC420B00]